MTIFIIFMLWLLDVIDDDQAIVLLILAWVLDVL